MSQAPSTPPNVVVFFTDQQRWDTTGIHGCPLDLTPNYDRMARQGTHFAEATTCQPVCGPARSCLQTGQYATTTGCWRNGIPLSPDATTMAKAFGQAGYDTGYIGKWHLASTRGAVTDPAERGGYDYWLASNALEATSNAYDTRLYDNDNREVRLPGYRVDAVTDAAIRYLDGCRESRRPFFLFLSYIEPHHQNHTDDYPPPEGYRERYSGSWMPPDLSALPGSAHQHWAGYCGMVKRLDEALGRIRDALKSLALSDDTIVLFTSDHGCHFKTRNGEYKRSCHESSIRVPCALTGPGFTAGGERREPFSLVDIAPTLIDAAGISVPATMQGRSAIPLIHNQSGEWPEEAFIQISESQVGRAIRTRHWKYGVVAPELHGGKDAGSDRYTETFLYDLDSDPYELTNLIDAESHEGVRNVLRNRLLRRMQEAGESPPEIVQAQAKRRGQRKVTPGEAEDHVDALSQSPQGFGKDHIPS